MTACICIIAATLLRYLDPYTSLEQTDEDHVGARFASEPGYYVTANGLKNPLAEKTEARLMHHLFRISETPIPGYDPDVPSALFKVNQVGYDPSQRKFAYLGAWLGPKLGAWRPHAPLSSWRIVDAASGLAVFESASPPLHRIDDAVSPEGVPFTGELTYELDFSSVTNPGIYYAEVPSVGRSDNFRISANAVEDAFRVHMLGLYQKRCGIAKTEPYTHWTAKACHRRVVRGTFAPDEGTLSAKVKWFEIIRDNTDWENGERLELVGGWHDAADYDRRPAHLNVVNDLCAVYLMKQSNFTDGQLAIPENRNGIPDILDEAEWGLRHLLAGQQADGGVGTWIETTGHPVPGNIAAEDSMRYALSAATRGSSLAYAAHASLLARCHPAFRTKYLESARRAWDFALHTNPRCETYEVRRTKGRFPFRKTQVIAVEWKEDDSLRASSLVKAAVNLHALTGDRRYLIALEERRDEIMRDMNKNSWRWPSLAFMGEIALGTPPAMQVFFTDWKRRVLKVANDAVEASETGSAYRTPWWKPGTGWFKAMSWGASHPLRRAQALVAAFEMTKDERYRAAAFAALDFHNGCNPAGMTLTSGLGKVYPIAFLDLPSYVDGIAEYVPGITPYRWAYGLPKQTVEMVYGGDRDLAAQHPIWRRWGNLENRTVAASEYTVWETIAPAASVCGYLLSPTGTPPPKLHEPAKRIEDLPGYWALP